MWCFGPFCLDPAARVLYRDGKPVALTPKQVDTLVVLVREAGQVVERERLLAEVWPGTFIEESGLTRNVSAIRKALEPMGGDPIETVPKRGYRFVAEVRREPVAWGAATLPATDGALPVLEAPAVPIRPRPRWLEIAAALTIVAGLAVAFLAWRTTPPRLRSLAVLPFDLRSDVADDKYVAAGLADLLTTRLSGLASLQVRSGGNVTAAAPADPIAAGRALGVDAVVRGTVERAGDRLRLNVQVLDTATAAPIFGGTFDERADATLALEDAMTDAVVGLLMPRLVNRERAAQARRGSSDPLALGAYFRGRYLLATRDPNNVDQALAAFDDAIRRDPSFALAFAAKAHAHIIQGDYQYQWPRDVFPKAKAAAIQALTLDGSLPDAHAALGEIAWEYDWDWVTAEQSLRRAVALAPNDATAHQWLAEYLNAMGRTDEARVEIDRAVALAPREFAPAAIRAELTYWNHRFDETLALADQAIALTDFGLSPLMYKHFALYRLGRVDEARALFASFAPAITSLPIAEAMTSLYEWRDGRRAEADARLRQLEARRRDGYVDAIYFASTFAERGDRDAAIRWLQQGLADRSTFMPFVAHDPFYETLHADPRFRAIVTGLGLGHLLRSTP